MAPPASPDVTAVPAGTIVGAHRGAARLSLEKDLNPEVTALAVGTRRQPEAGQAAHDARRALGLLLRAQVYLERVTNPTEIHRYHLGGTLDRAPS